MGCGSSLGIGSKVADRNPQEQANNDNSPLTPEEIRSRIVCSEKSTRLQLTPSLSIEYAFVSQRGYYPDAIDKPNQDSFTIIPSFAGDPSKIFFGIFDGHGATGDLCSIFAKKEVPERLLKLMAKGTPGNFAEIYSAAFTDTNAKLHTSRIDDSLSGTTAITCFMDGDIIHVANVGDSRAVIARNDQPRIVASPLSVDQTPYRTDERERVKRYGARVLTMDQLEGIAPIHENWATAINEEVDEDGDPPRVWSPTGNFPGTAFTRSIGDEIAESLGVFATPEIASLQLTPSDRYIIIASDGVFEFLTNQAVVDIIKAYSDPLEACEKVVTESYRLWLHYELRTDDITIVCIYLDHTASSHGNETNKERLQSQKNNDLITTNMLNDRVAELRPVRRGMSKQKRRDQMKKDMAKMVTEEDLNYKMNDHVILKSKQEMDKIQEITQANWLFKQLTAQQRNDVYKVMEKVTVNETDVVIRQGDPGDRFYCVQSGDFQVTVKNETPNGIREDIVHVYRGDTHPSFGELALMHNAPRSSSVIALTKGVLWAIDCRAFRLVFMKSPTNVIVQTLKKVDVLKSLTTTQLERLATNLTEITFEDGDYIINQGTIGNTFFVIKEGACLCTVWDVAPGTTERTSREVLRLRQHQYFGERALLNDAPRAANVISVGRTKLLQIGRQAFEEILGPLQKIIDNDRAQREAKHNFQIAVSNLREHNPEASSVKNDVARGQLSFKCVAQTSEVGTLTTFETTSKVRLTVRVVSKRQTKANNKIEEVMREAAIHKSMKRPISVATVPVCMGTWTDANGLYMAFNSNMVCDIAGLMLDAETKFSEDVIRQYAAQLLIGLETLHDVGIVYRNMNPENIMLDDNGYVQLHDFRYAKQIDDLRTYTLCGTAEYTAPEMVSAQGHSFGVDIWGLGILIYEMLYGITPFACDDLENDKDVVLAVYSKISRYDRKDLVFPGTEDRSKEVTDLLFQILNQSPYERLGCQGMIDINTGGSVIRSHPWFASVDWVHVAAGVQNAPHVQQIRQKAAQVFDAAAPLVLEPYNDASSWFDGF
ncbi:AGC protein kinase [Saprolegnia diclina VS20]|uniref:protein-serine/threonine phosphatase n=1 Tax=Saprolegnia diclina (strain VS20) TaxID=1156394 RepID=T0RJR6_SAPDV|nr:AGC protein kinase [Saprolegnia diclina VS20]EQC32468.1 AGC protein kinase [Saprolegnia diclina VS20]|eukprot:XP_008613969.1 AGC protein kinase [Saprolegnia diclina VS20]